MFAQNLNTQSVPPHVAVDRAAARRQKGFDLVQIAIVVGVIGVLMAAAFVGVPKVMAGVRATGEAQDLQAFMLAVNQAPASAVIDVNYIAENALYPTSQQVGTASTWKNRFGAELAFTRDDTKVTLVSPGVPSAACEKLLPILQNSFDEITVAGQAVKEANQTLVDSAAIKTACTTQATGGLVDITYRFYR